MIRASLLLCCLATPAFAAEKVPAPTYFVSTVMETSTAQMLAVRCSTLSIHLGKAALRSESVLVQLTKDGFEPSNLEDQMQDPSADVAVLQNAFVAKHNLRGTVTEDQICAAGQIEIAEGTGIGELLLGVAQ